MSLKRKFDDESEINRSVVTSEYKKEKFSILWDVKDFPQLTTTLFSPIFTRGEENQHHWVIEVLPKQNKSGEEYVQIYLRLKLSWDKFPVNVKFSLSLVDSELRILRKGTKKCALDHDNNSVNGYGFYMAKRSKVLDPKNKFLSEGHILRINCEVTVLLGWNSDVQDLNPKKSKTNEDDYAKIMKSFLADAEFSDVVLKTPEEEFPVSKIILAAQSPVFRVMFNSPMLESTRNIVNIEDFSADVVRGLLEFMYTGQVDFLECDVDELLRISDKYDVTGLKNQCEEILQNKIDIDNAAEILSLARIFHLTHLKSTAISFINRNRKGVQGSAAFKEMIKNQPEILQDLYSALK